MLRATLSPCATGISGHRFLLICAMWTDLSCRNHASIVLVLLAFTWKDGIAYRDGIVSFNLGHRELSALHRHNPALETFVLGLYL